MSLSLKCKESDIEKNVFKILKDENPTYSTELNLLCSPPKTLCFSFDYKKYFNKPDDEDTKDYEESFTTRNVFSKILPVNFMLSSIFDSVNDINSFSEEEIVLDETPRNKPLDYTCKLTSVIGYYGHHYIAFIRCNSEWYICEDSSTKLLGNASDLFDYFENFKILPYLVFYQTCEDEYEETPKSTTKVSKCRFCIHFYSYVLKIVKNNIVRALGYEKLNKILDFN